MARLKSTKPKVDWDAIEPHYRAGIRTLRDLEQEFGVTNAAILKHARVNDWSRNLLAKIQLKADAKVSAALVSAEVSKSTKVSELVRIEAEAEVQARIRIAQRSDITRFRVQVIKLLGELEEHAEDEDQKPLALVVRTKILKDLTDAIKGLVALEREAYGIDKTPEVPQAQETDPLEVARRLAFMLARAEYTMVEQTLLVH